MTTPVKRPEGRDEVVEALLDAAERLFATHGPGGVSLRTIAREAGVNHGLVHRHFGTKDALVDRLLERYADRWTAQVDADSDYTALFEVLLGTGPETGAYLRLLAWTLVGDRGDGSGDAHRRHARLDLLPGLLASSDDDRGDDATHDPTMTTAAALAFVFGWRFFNPFIRAALHLDDVDPARIQASMREQLRKMISA